MTCRNCGAWLAAEEKFCTNCGTPVAAESGLQATIPLLGLYITAGPGVGRSTQLGEITRIGRGAENEFRLYDPEVSREHAAVYRYDQGFAVNDVGSANGTFLNGKRVKAAAWIGPGDTIRVGNVQMQVTEPGMPIVNRPASAVTAGRASAEISIEAENGDLSAPVLWILMAFGLILTAVGAVGLIALLTNQ